MELKQIRYLVTALECGSILAASHRLGTNQSSVSRAIMHLESSVGVPLLTRHGRGVEATEAGRRFLHDAAPLLRELDKIHQDISASTESPSGTITVGLVPSVGDSLASGLIVRMREQWPGIVLKVHIAFSGDLTNGLVDGDIDVAVTNASRTPPRFHQRRLCVFDLFHVALRKSVHPSEWRNDTVHLASLAGTDLVLPTSAHGIRERIDEARYAAEITWRVVAETDSASLLVSLVRQGLGGTILPYAVIGREVADPNLLVRRVVAPTISSVLVLASPPDRPHSLAMRVSSQAIADEFRRAVADGRFIDGS